MGKKLIAGIILIVVGIFLPLLPLFQYPRLGRCFTIPTGTFIWSCGIVNLIPTIILVAIGIFLIITKNNI